jgi:hypothetical protein
LLAGENNRVEAARSGDGREINRHNYSVREIEQEVQRPVVRSIIKLIRFRNSHPAFNGGFALNSCSDHEISLGWNNVNDHARLHVDLQANTFEIEYNDGSSDKEELLSLG